MSKTKNLDLERKQRRDIAMTFFRSCILEYEVKDEKVHQPKFLNVSTKELFNIYVNLITDTKLQVDYSYFCKLLTQKDTFGSKKHKATITKK